MPNLKSYKIVIVLIVCMSSTLVFFTILYSQPPKYPTFLPPNLNTIPSWIKPVQGNLTEDLKVEDLYISVKTTSKHSHTRLQLIIDTWYQLAPNAIHFTTDSINLQNHVLHIKSTNCHLSHSLKDLLCKLQAELEGFSPYANQKKWFCHFDDDNYVNVFSLLQKLADFDPSQDWYLGKASWTRPYDRVTARKFLFWSISDPTIKFWFATGGAGFCLSQPLVIKMMPFMQNEGLVKLGIERELPDDVLVGYIIEYLLKVPMTVLPDFHSHLEPQKNVLIDNRTISYSYQLGEDPNILDIPSEYSDDPTRFKTLHARLFPNAR